MSDNAFHYVYVLKSLKNGNWYTGCTSDLRKRVAEHNNGKSTFTKSHGPYELVYYEASKNKNDAYARERYLKSGMGKRYIKNRLKLQINEPR
ncbi:MAG TPA: GIY-YIG nuclease family protein [Candidatus Saccharibacteria bacterium]|nr:GIY-YIG nuclease family protein [Candidatus Saccharibacteria bacterium]HRQ97724.1 GIY-YIG nuclease family protein [Candidatus Saccharibacteria bacterium]